MATTTSTFPALSVPAEDSMEVSSPANQVHDDGDIDLDFGDGDFDGDVTLQEDEQMLTEDEAPRPGTANDEMMDDDVQAVEPVVQEADMQDTPDVEQPAVQQDVDEELIDYGDEEYFDNQNTEDTTLVNVDEDDATLQDQGGEDVEQVDEEIVREPEDVGVEPTAVLDAAEFVGYEEVVGDEEHALDAAGDVSYAGADDAAQQQYDDPTDEALAQATEGDVAEFATAVETSDTHEPAAVTESVTEQPAISVDTTAYAAASDVPGTPTDTGLHPMTLYYGEYTMPLFKSKHQLDGLLKDDNLASLSLHELLRSCRQRLALKTGNDVSEDQELTLAFDHMGLMLVENSRAAFENSLNDVLDVYLQLHQNDGTEDTPPLSLSLTHQRFSSQLSVLKQAAAGGSGMSDFQPRSDEEKQEQEQEYQEGDGQEAYDEDSGEVATQEYDDEQQEQQYEQEALDHQEAEQLVEQPQAQEHSNDEQYDEENYDGQEYTEGQEYEGEQTDGTVPEQHEALADQAEVHQTGDTLAPTGLTDLVDDLEEAPAQEQLVANEPNAPAQGVEEAQKAASTASSETVRGDQATDSAGEYSEDMIDWDDDSSLTSVPSELQADGQDEFSTFLTEYEANEAKADQDSGDAETTAEQATDDEHVRSQHDKLDALPDPPATADEPAPELGSEDFLNDLEDQQHDPAADAEQDQDYQGEGPGDDEDQHDDQADTFDEQQEGYLYQPGEEDEQFHTAHDFLNDEAYEHGPEYQPNGEDYAAGEDEAAANQEPTDNAGDHAEEQYAEGEVQDDLEDDIINFDDDTTEQHEARQKTSPSENKATAASGPGSPLGKRSFDEHNAEDELNFDDDEEPEVKKVRSK